MENLIKCCISPTQSIADAMRILDVAAIGIALVVGENNRLVGTLTDGNIRRALLSGATLDSSIAPIMNKNFISVDPKKSRAEVLDLMQARYINQIPILDSAGRLLGLHLLHEMLGGKERPNIAVIMAGGRGKRLYPITLDLPKPMICIAGRPILERLILHLVSFGIRQVFISLNYLGHVIEEHFGDGKEFGCTIQYLRENEPLGTGGSLSLLPQRPEHPFLVLNGDLVTQLNIDALLSFHLSRKRVATMCVRRYFHQVPFGVVEVEDSCIHRLEEKPILEKFINAGIYVLSPDALDHIPTGSFMITSWFEGAIQRGDCVGAFEIEGDWVDVGRFEQLKQAREGC